MEKGELKTYQVEFLILDALEKQKMTIKSRDIKWTVDQIGRNRDIDGDIMIRELNVDNDLDNTTYYTLPDKEIEK